MSVPSARHGRCKCTKEHAIAKKPQLATSHQAEPAPAPVSKPQKAFTLERVNGGWIVVTVTFLPVTDGIAVLNVEKTVPDLKSIAIEKFKIAAFHYWDQW